MALVIPYTAQTWTDGVSAASAARLSVIEAGVHEAHFQPAVHVTHNAAQTTTTSVGLVVAFNTERYDTAGNVADTMHDTVTNNGRLTCRYAGIYSIKATIAFAASAAGLRQLDIRLNGATIIDRQILNNVGAGAESTIQCEVHWQMAVNDYVELVALQTSGGNLNINNDASYSPEFYMVRVG